jgi:hypothetical protein
MSMPDRDLEPEEALRAELEAELEAGEAADLDVEVDPVAEPASPEAPEVAIAFSPRQILGGFALIAAIVVWLFRRRKR